MALFLVTRAPPWAGETRNTSRQTILKRRAADQSKLPGANLRLPSQTKLAMTSPRDVLEGAPRCRQPRAGDSMACQGSQLAAVRCEDGKVAPHRATGPITSRCPFVWFLLPLQKGKGKGFDEPQPSALATPIRRRLGR